MYCVVRYVRIHCVCIVFTLRMIVPYNDKRARDPPHVYKKILSEVGNDGLYHVQETEDCILSRPRLQAPENSEASSGRVPHLLKSWSIQVAEEL